jgi:hypothetical protein
LMRGGVSRVLATDGPEGSGFASSENERTMLAPEHGAGLEVSNPQGEAGNSLAAIA